jgi:hypothetical protein
VSFPCSVVGPFRRFTLTSHLPASLLRRCVPLCSTLSRARQRRHVGSLTPAAHSGLTRDATRARSDSTCDETRAPISSPPHDFSTLSSPPNTFGAISSPHLRRRHALLLSPPSPETDVLSSYHLMTVVRVRFGGTAAWSCRHSPNHNRTYEAGTFSGGLGSCLPPRLCLRLNHRLVPCPFWTALDSALMSHLRRATV